MSTSLILKSHSTNCKILKHHGETELINIIICQYITECHVTAAAKQMLQCTLMLRDSVKTFTSGPALSDGSLVPLKHNTLTQCENITVQKHQTTTAFNFCFRRQLPKIYLKSPMGNCKITVCMPVALFVTLSLNHGHNSDTTKYRANLHMGGGLITTTTFVYSIFS